MILNSINRFDISQSLTQSVQRVLRSAMCQGETPPTVRQGSRERGEPHFSIEGSPIAQLSCSAFQKLAYKMIPKALKF